jgi:hypothetical protein
MGARICGALVEAAFRVVDKLFLSVSKNVLSLCLQVKVALC